MPEGEDGGAGDEIAGSGAGVGDVAVAEGEAEEADEEGGEGWDDGEETRTAQKSAVERSARH